MYGSDSEESVDDILNAVWPSKDRAFRIACRDNRTAEIKSFLQNGFTVGFVDDKNDLNESIKYIIKHDNAEVLSSLLTQHPASLILKLLKESALSNAPQCLKILYDYEEKQVTRSAAEKKEFKDYLSVLAIETVKHGKEHSFDILFNLVPVKDLRDSNGNTLLMLAANANPRYVTLDTTQRSFQFIFEKLLDAAVDLDAQNAFDETALMVAAECGNIYNLERLISRGANLNIQDSDGRTALMFACRLNKTEVIKVLIAAGAQSYLKNNAGQQAAEIAMDPNTKQVLKNALNGRISGELIIHAAEKLTTRDALVPLTFFFSPREEFNELRSLQKKSLNSLTYQSISEDDMPLAKAIKRENNTFTEKRIAELAGNPSAETQEELTSGLLIAADYRNYKLMERLIVLGANPTKALSVAVQKEDLVEINLLCRKGASIHVRQLGKFEHPLLFDAARTNNVVLLQYMICNSDDPVLLKRDLQATLIAGCDAAYADSIELEAGIIDILIDSGAEVNAEDENRSSEQGPRFALGNALVLDNFRVVKQLLNRGADPNLLHLFAWSDDRLRSIRIDYLKTLLNAQKPLNKDAVNPQTGETLLHRLVSFSSHRDYLLFPGNDKRVVLVEACANLNIQDHQGITVSMLAAERKNTGMLALLISKGADLALTARDGKKVSDYLLAWSNDEKIKLVSKLKETYPANQNVAEVIELLGLTSYSSDDTSVVSTIRL